MSSRKVRTDLLDRVREVENVFIPMPDGTRLAARLFLPADGEPVPGILEYIPYRKRDFMRARDEPMHRYFAAHGYAVARVDVRGSGDSEGVMTDEYSPQEQDDAEAVIAWMAAQDWCSGKVGMMGISWGGFNALQVAARRPPALGAIISLCASDDRYADDAHYMGGLMLNENLQWGSILMAYQAMPPDPAIVGERYDDMWRARLEGLPAFPALWMQHPHRDAHWKQGSVCEDYAAIRCPVFVVGGWADGYTNSVGRTLAGLPGADKKGLIGPWAHTFPHRGYPGPSIGFLQEAIRWWDHWLKDRETGIMDEPMLRVWLQESVSPEPHYDERPGRWVAEASWPSDRIERLQWAMNRKRLALEPEPERALTLRSPQSTGAVAGEWCAFGAPGEMPLDQRPDDGRSLVFDSEPLGEPLELLGAPEVELEVSSDVPVAMVAVRLNEVAPTGASTRLSYGLLNLTHRDGHEQPVALVPGERVRVKVRLNDVGVTLTPGNRLRIAVSTAYWPIAWPGPERATLTLWSGVSQLMLPVRPPSPLDASLLPFPDPEECPGVEHEPLRPVPFKRVTEHDLVTNERVYTLTSDGGEFGDHSHAYIEAIDMTLGYSMTKRHRIRPTDPLSACTEFVQWIELEREGWKVRIDCATCTKAAPEHFRFTATVSATQNGELVFERQWDEAISRQLG